jgi:hypothetical protein
MSSWKTVAATLAAGILVWTILAAEDTPDKSHKLQSVSIRKMADSVHAVIAADRQTYAELVLQPMSANHAQAGATSRRGPLDPPVHAHMLRHAAASIQTKGAEFSYTLRSLWPINPGHGPQTEAEERGLQAVARNPDRPVYTEEELGGRSYFTAIYADRATLPACVSCHNAHPASPRSNFKEGDVMGAIVVRVPLEF